MEQPIKKVTKGGHTMKKFLLIFMVIILIGCSKQIPEPDVQKEKKESIDPIQMEYKKAIPTLSFRHSKTTFDVYYSIKNKDLLIDCYIPSVTFNKNIKGNDDVAKIVAYVNGKNHSVYHSPAFIISNLQKGTNKITLEVHTSGKKERLTKEFIVTIP